MNPKANYQKFRKHLKNGGIFYAFWRGIKYFIFLLRNYFEIKKLSELVQNITISRDKIKIICTGGGIKLYWNECQITKEPGLNSAINTQVGWGDTSKDSEWRILKRNTNSLKLNVKFKNLPVTQIWDLKILNRNKIRWRIKICLNKDLHIDDRCVACLVPNSYVTWFSANQYGKFPRILKWQDIFLKDIYSKFIGVMPDPNGGETPVLALQFSDYGRTKAVPRIQNTPILINARILSVKLIDEKKIDYYLPGEYRFFNGNIVLFDNENYLTKDRNRKEYLKTFFIRFKKIYIYGVKQKIKQGVAKSMDYIKRKIRAELSEGLMVSIFAKLRLIYKNKESMGLLPALRETKDHYLDIIGIFSKRLALKGPYFVQIDLTNKCNNNCIACWCNSDLVKMKRNDGQSLHYKKVITLISTLKKMGTKEIYLAGGGEPFMHPQLLEIIRYIKKKGLVCYLNTNFTLIDENIVTELVKLKLDYLIVSLWAGSSFAYKITHPNKDKMTFYRIGQMLKFLSQIKETAPYLCITNVIFNQNWRDIENMINFALEVKANAINFAVIDVFPGMTDNLLLNDFQRQGVLKNIKEKMGKKEIKENIAFWDVETFVRRLSNPFSNTGDYDKGLINNVPCYAGWLFSRILANGDVNACLKAHRIPMGNIYKDNFRKIWNSKKQQEFRRRTCVIEKKDPFFIYIGNNSKTEEAGCYRSCDDFERNVNMHRHIELLLPVEKRMCHYVAKFVNILAKK